MLPEVLSNFACSVQMKKKYTFSAIFEITETSQVVNGLEELIYSDQRFAYEEAQYIIETKDDIPEEISITGTSYQVSAEIVAATLKWMN
jgi:ribonuclease R